MEPDNKIYHYKVIDKDENWGSFNVMVHKGKVVRCALHPIGSDWKSLKAYYEKAGATIEEIKDEISN